MSVAVSPGQLAPGDPLTPAPRRAIVDTIQAATGASRSACGNAVAGLLVDGCVTAGLLDLHQRAAALLAGDRGPNRCPRCLEARAMDRADRCRACDVERQRSKAATRPRDVQAAPPVDPGPIAPAPVAVLDQFDIEDIKRMCAGKRAYVSSIDADRVARRCEYRRGVALRTYHCPACLSWHITKAATAPEHLR